MHAIDMIRGVLRIREEEGRRGDGNLGVLYPRNQPIEIIFSRTFLRCRVSFASPAIGDTSKRRVATYVRKMMAGGAGEDLGHAPNSDRALVEGRGQ